MEWNRRELKRKSRRQAFGRGWQVWLALVAICFVFSFVGSEKSGATGFLQPVDHFFGWSEEALHSNAELLTEYLLQEDWVAENHWLNNELIGECVNVLSRDFSWLLHLLAANAAYMKRNATEVWVYLLIAAVVHTILRFFVQNGFVIGKYRFLLEQSVYTDTKLSRCLAPFHKKHVLHIVGVMLLYRLELMLWWLTIAGGFYKTYQYRMIPFLLAENPELSYRTAKKMSVAMTKGTKWKQFCLDFSMLPVVICENIPFVGLLYSLPYEAAKDVQVYLWHRNERCPEAFRIELIEGALSQNALVLSQEPSMTEEMPAFLLPGIIPTEEEREQKYHQFAYGATDFILMFFIFSGIGWVWEVLLHLVNHHELVNRGTLYGPWLPIYGTGGLLFILLLDRRKEKPIKTFFDIVLIAGVLEFFTSWLLDFLFNARYWSYQNMFANLNGRICLAGLLAFGIGGSFAIYIAGPYLRMQFRKVPTRWKLVISGVLILLLLADLFCCIRYGFHSGAGVGGKY